jgi:hypothetical protein
MAIPEARLGLVGAESVFTRAKMKEVVGVR